MTVLIGSITGVARKRKFNGKEFTLTAASRHGVMDLDHAISIVEMNKKYGAKNYRIVKSGKYYYVYTKH